MSKSRSKDEIDQYIIRTVKENEPDNVSKLVKLVQKRFSLSEREILDRIRYLQGTEKLLLKPQPMPREDRLTDYLCSAQAYWYWATVLLSITTTVLVFTVPENAFPLSYARYISGSVFVLWLPGYAFARTLFPRKELESIERITLSVGMSLALVSLTGLLLYYTPLGMGLTTVTICLLALTIALATAAAVREHRIRVETSREKKGRAKVVSLKRRSEW